MVLKIETTVWDRIVRMQFCSPALDTKASDGVFVGCASPEGRSSQKIHHQLHHGLLLLRLGLCDHHHHGNQGVIGDDFLAVAHQ